MSKEIVLTESMFDKAGTQDPGGSIGLILNDLRVDSGLYQKDVGDKATKGHQWRISEIETGYKIPGVKTLIRFLGAIGYVLVIRKAPRKKRSNNHGD